MRGVAAAARSGGTCRSRLVPSAAPAARAAGPLPCAGNAETQESLNVASSLEPRRRKASMRVCPKGGQGRGWKALPLPCPAPAAPHRSAHITPPPTHRPPLFGCSCEDRTVGSLANRYSYTASVTQASVAAYRTSRGGRFCSTSFSSAWLCGLHTRYERRSGDSRRVDRSGGRAALLPSDRAPPPRGGGGGGHMVVLLSAAGGAYWPLATYRCLRRRRCPSASHHLVPSLSLLGLSSPPYKPFLALGTLCLQNPRAVPVPCSVSGPHRGGQRPSPLARGVQTDPP